MKKQDRFALLAPGKVALSGWLGKSLELSIENRLKKVDYRHLAQPFLDRSETDGRWRCEFWGKIVRSAIRSWRGRPDAELKKLIDNAVAYILEAQTEDGCISSYPADKQAHDWDMWGRKYVLLGLARYCHVIEDREDIRKAMTACLRHLMTQVGPGAETLPEAGWHDGMAPASILGAIMQIYWLTGEKDFLDYAEWIVKDGGCKVFEQVLNHDQPVKICNGKAYEMTSCVEGLLEMYRETGRKDYLEAAMTYFHKMVDTELFVTGVGGLMDVVGEYWGEGHKHQATKDLGGRGETCVTVTVVRFCLNILRLTGDITAAEQLECSLYNGVLSEMEPDGSWWMHLNPTPLSGPACKTPAPDQLPGFGEDCCLAQGPEGVATAPMVAVMKNEDDVVVNLYESCHAELDEGLSMDISGDYPFGSAVKLTVSMTEKARYFGVQLRIPSWSKNTVVKVNGEAVAVTAGSYARIARVWKNGDVIEMALDVQLEVTADPAGTGLKALKMGPLVLARDSRLGDVDKPYPETITAKRVADRPGMKVVYELNDGSLVCDFASAANEFTEGNTLRLFC